MNNLQIEKILKNHITTKKYFLGAFPSDKLPVIFSFPSCFISNTDTSKQPGSHRVAFFIPSQNQVEFFDSFGNTPNQLHLNFLKRFSRVTQNPVSFQSIFSDDCAEYCIFFLFLRSKGISFNSIISKLRSVNDSDLFVRRFVYEILEG